MTEPRDEHLDHSGHGDPPRSGQTMAQEHTHPPGDDAHHDHHDGHGGHGGHQGHAGHGVGMFRTPFWITLVLSIPVVWLSPLVASLLGYQVPEFPLSQWIAPVLGTVIYFYGGAPFLKGGLQEIRSRQPGMMLLIAMAITVAFVASWITFLGIGGFSLDFWWELALLVVVMLLGHWMEMRALGSASSALDALAELLPDEAERIPEDGGDPVTVSISELAVGDIVLVRSGGRVPADGVITDGSAGFDESMITGESRTVSRGAGETVVAGTVATDNSVRLRVEALGEDTTLSGIQRMVSEAQESSSRAQALADRAAALLFWFALGAAIITAIVWVAIGQPSDAVTRTVTVLVIACPHALGLAIPLVIAISTERAATAGVLIKNRLALEKMRTVDVVLFDKTGTLTEGAHAVTGTATTGGISGDELLQWAAAAESESEHPVARAITTAAEAAGPGSGSSPKATNFQAAAGRGVKAEVDGVEVMVGGPNMLRELGLEPTPELREDVAGWIDRGASILHVVRDRVVLGAIALEDRVRQESREAVDALRSHGVKVALITGDAQQVADAVARDLGIDEVFAEVLPRDKDAKVTELQQRGLSVAMVGDGVNDAPALARAEVGIAIGAGTDIAVESAGVVLAGNDPRSVVSLLVLSRASYAKMLQNLWWAGGYNIIAVPLAAGVLAPIGFVLSPAVGAVLMSLSTIIVALNAQLLRRVELAPERVAGTRSDR
ncbi:heavy metal translocating P-type ATPase [Arthrobacter rhombi]|uniref:heavy metal translocating P-type ATPase n=1 Tax=Arthrobacter rhombi TaxID=71253 RepID=UPI003FD24B22